MSGNQSSDKENQANESRLNEQIGKLQVQNEWLKKVVVKYNLAERRSMVCKNDALSISEQCELVSVQRSGFYYKPKGESPLNLDIMRLTVAYFLEHPHSSLVTPCTYLCLAKGYTLKVKRICRLMGLTAVYPGKKLSLFNNVLKIHTCSVA